MPSFRYYVPQLTLAKVLLARDTTESRQQASDLLFRLHSFFTSIHDTRTLIEVLALQALLHDARGEEPAALEKLTRAIALSELGGFIRLFVDLGPKMAVLLDCLANKSVAARYVGQLLAAFRNEEQIVVPDASDQDILPSRPPVSPSLHPQPLIEPLTNRELEILTLLEQRLRNKEIAEKLFISPETVKRHTINIYGKLNVHNRREAVARAQELGMVKG